MTGRFKKLINNKVTRNIILIFTLLAILFIAIWTRAFIGSMKDFSKGEDFFQDKQYIRAITFFDRSMHWYAPFNPYIKRSAEHLWEISELAEQQLNDEKLSLIAIETIRNSFYGSRSFYSPGTTWVKRCEDRIKYIVLKQDEERYKAGGVDSYQNGKHESDMKYNDPDIFWTIILEIGLFGWIAAVLGFIYFSLGSNKKVNRFIHNYWLWIIFLLFAYGLWIIGMIKA